MCVCVTQELDDRSSVFTGVKTLTPAGPTINTVESGVCVCVCVCVCVHTVPCQQPSHMHTGAAMFVIHVCYVHDFVHTHRNSNHTHARTYSKGHPHELVKVSLRLC